MIKSLIVALGAVTLISLPAKSCGETSATNLSEFYTHLRDSLVVTQAEYTTAVDGLTSDDELQLTNAQISGMSLLQLNNKIVYNLIMIQAQVDFMVQGLKNLDKPAETK